jgi:hypothetical protein
MNKFRTEDLKPFSQFFDLMLNVFFYGGSFMKAITDVNVHERLGLANEVRNQVLSCNNYLSRIVHPEKKTQAEN